MDGDTKIIVLFIGNAKLAMAEQKGNGISVQPANATLVTRKVRRTTWFEEAQERIRQAISKYTGHKDEAPERPRSGLRTGLILAAAVVLSLVSQAPKQGTPEFNARTLQEVANTTPVTRSVGSFREPLAEPPLLARLIGASPAYADEDKREKIQRLQREGLEMLERDMIKLEKEYKKYYSEVANNCLKIIEAECHLQMIDPKISNEIISLTRRLILDESIDLNEYTRRLSEINGVSQGIKDSIRNIVLIHYNEIKDAHKKASEGFSKLQKAKEWVIDLDLNRINKIPNIIKEVFGEIFSKEIVLVLLKKNPPSIIAEGKVDFNEK